ncbi:hypothetical protein [Beijerinckia sp. L45]|uniref:hypothetical protein n=1 Tax=Beijerinckia sp. L45 TaxID=1641855 RepID=UPI00131CB03B|nr:hypothetical protein [Beijerinckia sp. L45]
MNLPIVDGGKRTALERVTVVRDGAPTQYRGRVPQAVQEVENALAVARSRASLS